MRVREVARLLGIVSFVFFSAYAAGGSGWVAGTVYMTQQDVALHFLRMPLPGFRFAVLTDQGEAASACTEHPFGSLPYRSSRR